MVRSFEITMPNQGNDSAKIKKLESELKRLATILGQERDAFGKREIELMQKIAALEKNNSSRRD